MHESTLAFPYALMACGMVLNITQGHGSTHIYKTEHGSTHITLCELLLVTVSESVLLMYYTENIVNNITVT